MKGKPDKPSRKNKSTIDRMKAMKARPTFRNVKVAKKNRIVGCG